MADQQLYKVNEVMARLGVTDQTIRQYCNRFSQFLSGHAAPAAGQTRRFTETDVRILTLARNVSGQRSGDAVQLVAEAVASGKLPEMPDMPITKGGGAQIVQAYKETWLAERASMQEKIEILQDQIGRLQGEYDRERAAHVDDLKASAQELADLRERIGRAEGALSAYKEIAASAPASTPAAQDTAKPADGGGRRKWFGLGGG